jgi:3',5'-cyclic AMP phosphodiesterase CpdA
MHEQEFHQSTRRDVILGAGLAATATLASCAAPRGGLTTTAPEGVRTVRERILRIAHLTDMHVQPERRAGEGFAAALDAVHALNTPPDLVVTGGDLVMDAFGAKEERTHTQWALFKRVLRERCRIPVRHCIGNHDIWGWDKKAAGCVGSELLWGKNWFRDTLGLERTYGGTDIRNWRIIRLDTVQPEGESGYKGGLDDEQFEWLKGELAGAKGMHVVVFSHIPIINISTLLADADVKKEGWDVSPGLMCTDARRIVNLFEAAGNVRAALSGHIHTVEEATFQGVRYINNGAVSGNWWKSQEKTREERRSRGLDVGSWASLRSDPGFGVLDLYADGTLEAQYVTYGWKGEA